MAKKRTFLARPLREIPNGQNGPIMPAQVANQIARFVSSRPPTDITEESYRPVAKRLKLNHVTITSTGAVGPRGMMGLKGDPGESISLPVYSDCIS